MLTDPSEPEEVPVPRDVDAVGVQPPQEGIFQEEEHLFSVGRMSCDQLVIILTLLLGFVNSCFIIIFYLFIIPRHAFRYDIPLYIKHSCLSFTIISPFFFLVIVSPFLVWAIIFPEPEGDARARRNIAYVLQLLTVDVPWFSLHIHTLTDLNWRFVDPLHIVIFAVQAASFGWSALKTWLYIIVRLRKATATTDDPSYRSAFDRFKSIGNGWGPASGAAGPVGVPPPPPQRGGISSGVPVGGGAAWGLRPGVDGAAPVALDYAPSLSPAPMDAARWAAAGAVSGGGGRDDDDRWRGRGSERQRGDGDERDGRYYSRDRRRSRSRRSGSEESSSASDQSPRRGVRRDDYDDRRHRDRDGREGHSAEWQGWGAAERGPQGAWGWGSGGGEWQGDARGRQGRDQRL